jgi:hypothetical protein
MGKEQIMSYLKSIAIASAFFLAGLAHASAAQQEITVYKSPWCRCCTAWSEHMRENGFKVTEIKREDMDTIKRELGVPEQLESCHTAMIDGYVVEGHVPADDVKKLLTERPKAKGLSVPGMPMGSPGMEQGNQKDRYTVIIYGDEGMGAFARH